MALSPFEIRLELLKMSKELLMDGYYSDKDKITQDWNIKCDTARQKGETPPEHPALPTIPSEQDIITKAHSLNGFVSGDTPGYQTPVRKKS